MTHLIYIAVLAFIFRFFRELEDEVARGNFKNWSLFPNSHDGSTAKWKYPLQVYEKKWYHFGFKCNHVERFPYSSTVFVWVTDAEHLYQFVQTICLWAFAYITGGWMVLAAFVFGLMIAQVVKEKIKTIN